MILLLHNQTIWEKNNYWVKNNNNNNKVRYDLIINYFRNGSLIKIFVYIMLVFSFYGLSIYIYISLERLEILQFLYRGRPLMSSMLHRLVLALALYSLHTTNKPHLSEYAHKHFSGLMGQVTKALPSTSKAV